jgi:hypothetical protein
MAEGRDRRNPDDRGYRPRRPRARKDTKRWCRGKVGVEHTPVLDYRSFIKSYRDQPYCRVPPPWNPWKTNWWCHHIEKCSECGKTLRHSLDVGECPDFRPGQEM